MIFRVISIACVAIVAIQILIMALIVISEAIDTRKNKSTGIIYCGADGKRCWHEAPYNSSYMPCDNCWRNPYRKE